MQQERGHLADVGSNPPSRYLACLPAFLGGVAALLAMLLGGVAWLASQRIPLLTEQAYHDGSARWQAQSIRDYEIEINVTGRQPAVYRVVVENGMPVTAERNGFLLPQERVWRTWSVDGMFSTVQRDLVNEDRPNGKLLVRTEFHPTYGYPNRYLRIQIGQATDVSWKVLRFVELNPRTEPSLP